MAPSPALSITSGPDVFGGERRTYWFTCPHRAQGLHVFTPSTSPPTNDAEQTGEFLCDLLKVDVCDCPRVLAERLKIDLNPQG